MRAQKTPTPEQREAQNAAVSSQKTPTPEQREAQNAAVSSQENTGKMREIWDTLDVAALVAMIAGVCALLCAIGGGALFAAVYVIRWAWVAAS